jgi:polysaccharide chain length determinant protein (PEP-CTERM system associated)
MHELAEQLLSHLKAIWRYRWYAVVFAWIIALGGWTAVYKVPDRYEADARVYVDTQSVLRPLLVGLAVQPNLDQMVTIMSQTLISRPNLEKVVGMAGLDVGLNTDDDRARLIARLTKEIAIKSAGKENIYTISWADKDPQMAKRVVESLLKLFVEGSLLDNRKDSDQARNFIDEQLKGYREKLEIAENAITAFKRRHPGLMPGEGPSYYARLIEAKTALSRAVLELKEAENSRDSIKKQLASERESPIPSLPGDKVVGGGANPETELDARIRLLEQKLDGLRLSYTEQHPDIVAIVPIIAQLRERKEAEATRLREQAEAEGKLRGPLPTAAQARSPIYQQLIVSLTTAEANVAAMKTRVAEYNQRYAELQAAANAIPQVEAEYIQLTRDYEVNKTRYDELLKRRESAQISGDMEASDVAMGFRVIDPPHVPRTPKSPGRPLLMSLVLLAALGGGLGAAFLISQMRPTINDERRLRELSGLPVLGTVVMGWTDAQKSRRNRGLVALLISYASLLSAYAAIMAVLLLTVSRA